MTSYKELFNPHRTPQSEQAAPEQVKNSAGGYSFELDRWARLERWLILGSDQGSYYASPRELTHRNAKIVLECWDQDPEHTAKTIEEISTSGRAVKNDPAIFALALGAAHTDQAARNSAYKVLNNVCRISTHLFYFVSTVSAFRGWGRGLKRAVAKWYTEQPTTRLAYQIAKYRNRHGFSHRDVLRLSHPKTSDKERNRIFAYAVGKKNVDHVYFSAVEQLKHMDRADKAAELIREFRLTHEMVPNDLKNDPVIWEALLEEMPLTALVRNLGKMTSIGVFAPFSTRVKEACWMLRDTTQIRNARLHPLQLLTAVNVYGSGCGFRGSLNWTPVSAIQQALEDAFYLSFETIEPTNKNTLLALDVSGSMGSCTIQGMPYVTPAIGAAAMAMVTARTEPHHEIRGFTGDFLTLGITAADSLGDAARKAAYWNFGRTDCALPMIWAKENKVPVEVFYVYTDNETWHGNIHPHQALREYRQAMGIDARMVVVGMVSNGFSIADPNDPGMLDVVGFDTAAPRVMSDFARGVI